MKYLLSLFAFCMFSLTANAKIKTIQATGSGVDERIATMNAIESAIMQTHAVSMNGSTTKSKEIHEDASSSFKGKGNINENADNSFSTKASNSAGISASSGKGMFDKESASLETSEKAFVSGKASSNYHADYDIDNKASSEYNYKEVEQEIKANYKGKIEGYKILKTEQKEGKYFVTIEAKVFELDEYKSKDLVKKAKYSVAIAPIQKNSSVLFECNETDMTSFPEDLQNAIIENLVSSKRLNIVDRSSMDTRMKELSLTTAGLTDRNNLNKLNKVLSADYMLVATVDAYDLSSTSRVLEITGETVKSVKGKVSISYKLFETATTEIVAASHVEENIDLQNVSLSCSDLSSKLLRKVAKAQADKMLSFLFSDYTSTVEKESFSNISNSSNNEPIEEKKRPVIEMPW